MAVTLVSMKLDANARKESLATSGPKDDGPLYPWGLGLTLDDETLETLGIDELPKVGGTLMLYAKVDVTSVSSNENADGANRSVSLQITDCCLEPDAGETKSDAASLYGDAQTG